MSEELKKLIEIKDAVDTIQETISELSEQIGRLHESVTGVQDGPGGREAPYSLTDIGNMLAGLHIVFEPQFRAKAFEFFNEEADRQKKHGDDKNELAEALIKGAASYRLGVLPGMRNRLYEQWKAQRSME